MFSSTIKVNIYGCVVVLWHNESVNVNPGLSFSVQYLLVCVRLLVNLLLQTWNILNNGQYIYFFHTRLLVSPLLFFGGWWSIGYFRCSNKIQRHFNWASSSIYSNLALKFFFLWNTLFNFDLFFPLKRSVSLVRLG